MLTEVPADTFGEFSRLLDACKEGCRLLTYLDLRVWRLPGSPFRSGSWRRIGPSPTGTRRRGPYNEGITYFCG